MLAALAMALGTAPTVWYGPVAATFDVSFPGNPYDAGENDVRVRFEGPREETRVAFYDEGRWNAILLTRHPGVYRARLIRNGRATPHPTQEVRVSAEQRLRDGFVRVAPDRRRFVFDSGRAYFPLGYNVSWPNREVPSIPDEFEQMRRHGANWARVWASHWGGYNPFWHDSGPPVELGRMSPEVLRRWDELVAAAERTGVSFQFVLFHHGPLSTRVNPNWSSHPWNVANGGFLGNPADFFTDPKAKSLTRNWLRLAVARWGHSPAIMAWELFNEVEWVDARYDGRWADIHSWHREMAQYLRRLDPTGRLITTSSTMEEPELWSAMDFYQPHTYPSSVLAAILGQTLPRDKPLFFGEFGPSQFVPARERYVVRDGIWAGILGGHAGAAQYWYWDRVAELGLRDEYRIAADFLTKTRLPDRGSARPADVRVDLVRGGVLELRPGLGWGKTTKFVFDLPGDADPRQVGRLSSYLQSETGGNRGLFAEPLVLRFRAARPGKIRIELGTVARAGAELVVDVNGREAFRRAWPPAATDRQAGAGPELDFPAGDVEVRLRNPGPDWVAIDKIAVDGLAPAVTGFGIGDREFLAVRLTRTAGIDGPQSVGLARTGLADGNYTVSVTDLDTGRETRSTATVRRGELARPMRVVPRDAVVVFRVR
ncbi:MAG: cellulase family glycosylhydrolase [Fimbriimonadaceae bacterium]